MGNRLSKIYTKTGDDGSVFGVAFVRASCANDAETGETRGFRRFPTGASRRLRAGIHTRVVVPHKD